MKEPYEVEEIIWKPISEFPKEEGQYLVKIRHTDIVTLKILDLSCSKCVQHWKAYYEKWAECPHG